MRQIKSLWTRPQRWRHTGAEELWSWSILRLCKFYGSITIHTDELGKLWIEALRLPVNGRMTITRMLDDLAHHDPHVWSIGKLYCNSQQTEPFIQTDGDVVIGRTFPRRMHDATVCAERLYSNVPGPWFAGCHAPDHWHRDFAGKVGTSFNCGTFGGNDVAAIRKISRAGFEFAIRNIDLLRTVRSDLAAIACEEWAIAREYDPLEVTCLSSMDPAGSEMLANAKAYWHQPGESKIDPETQNKVRDRLELDCPGQVSRCREVARSFSGVR